MAVGRDTVAIDIRLSAVAVTEFLTARDTKSRHFELDVY